MKRIAPSKGKPHWPRHAAPTIECRKRDLVIRIADWTRQSMRTGEPAYDVEVYVGGVYDWNLSETHTLREHGTKERAKVAAIQFAQNALVNLL